MCQHDQAAGDSNHGSPQPTDDFPWHLGAYDAHCHPTDTMASIDNLARMRTSVLTIMATRSQDQDLVAEVAASHGLATTTTTTDLPDATGASKVVPAFAWHPWFSHQRYDDSAAEPTYHQPDDGTSSPSEAKRAHYRAVLQPPPDDAFIDSLPDPVPISAFIAATAARLEAYPLALVGEAGLDKAFRLPEPWAEAEAADDDDAALRDDLATPGGRQGRRLSPHRVRMSHQQAVLTAQLALAGRFGRAVSLHGVQAHGVLYDTVARCWAGCELPSRREKKLVAPGAEDFSSSSSSSEDDEDDNDDDDDRIKPLDFIKQKQTKKESGKPYPPRICLHSFSGSASTLAQWMRRNVPAAVYVSFSAAINLSTETSSSRGKTDEVIRAVPDDRLLVESDLHKAGDDMDGMLEVMYRHVCEVKGWEVEDGVARIRKNYETFIFG
ncbi:Cut9-interacting protein scn1 [Beauveria brongniartii RCEF 3172]|uniref:Cut9-interacting protein scn1 n=1 Tax=Beauveria brongniartii RCEF 3172 TaxID=1081107 RepID=A0A167B9X9_9HYPO|nr:Cut9-interacting protein scn1 [Beauveria brongniartii RCEF 3172]